MDPEVNLIGERSILKLTLSGGKETDPEVNLIEKRRNES